MRIKPIKYLGQNFLIDKNVVKKIIRAANLKPQDIVLEIGPGTGVLTQAIAKRVKKVIAVEKDPRMCKLLKENLKDFNNIEIISADILKLVIDRDYYNSPGLLQKNYKVIANLPFYITAPVIRKFLEAKNPAQEMFLIIQKEVAQRIYAKPGQMSILAVSVQFYADVKILFYVSKKSFTPQPKVDSAIIQIKPNKKYKADKNKFFKIVKAGFSQPRKQLINNLSKKLKLDKEKLSPLLVKINIKPSQRAQSLSIQDWIELSKML
jgi:16S rRNA (adenine1518-N6/adenine1519-N6)-dimethyltransferase